MNCVRQCTQEAQTHLLNVLVGHELADVGERSTSSLLDVGLGVPDRLGQDRDDVGHRLGELLGRTGHEEIEDLERAELHLPLARGLDLLEQRRQ